MPVETPSYISYKDNSSQRTSANLQTTDNLFQVDAGLLGGADLDQEGSCNISFDSFFELDFNLPEFDFFTTASEFDRSLFDKLDQLSLEVSMINDMLINSILDMECCDIAGKYNSTLVPFFKFFADSEGDSVMDILITMAEVISDIKAIVEPLECLMVMIPGDPWEFKDIDMLSWIYGWWKESGPLLDKFMSGEYVDMLVNPISTVRTQLQACLGTGESFVGDFQDVLSVGTASQVEKLAILASKSGEQITEAQLLKPTPVKKPIASDYRQGEGDGDYQKAMKAYETSKGIYEKQVQIHTEVSENITKQTELQKEVNANLAIAIQTNTLVKVSTDGICGCVADVLGLKDTSIIPMPVKTTKDMTRLIGKTINGVTNKDAGTTSKDRPADDTLTVQATDLTKDSAVTAILEKSESKGNPQKASKGSETRTEPCPYTEAGIPGGMGTINAECVLIDFAGISGQKEIKDANDEKEKFEKEVNQDLIGTTSKASKANVEMENFWKLERKTAHDAMTIAQGSVNSTRAAVSGFSAATRELATISADSTKADLEVSMIIFDAMFGVYIPFDFVQISDNIF